MAKRRRLVFVLFVMTCTGLAAALALYALRDNVAYFYTPGEVKTFRARDSAVTAPGRVFRLGGLVEKGSLSGPDKALTVRFTVTDTTAELPVEYTGMLPDLFREGQGVVATGSLDAEGHFHATQLLAKHDEKYMPPEVAKGLKRAHDKKYLEGASSQNLGNAPSRGGAKTP
jgi:cytochrome c-type biogenesis protein CcmE